MVIVAWIITGIFIGAIAKNILPRRSRGGWVSTIGLGVVGAVAGGLIFRLATGGTLGSLVTDPWSWASLPVAIVGAAVLAFGWRFLRIGPERDLRDPATEAEARVQGQERP